MSSRPCILRIVAFRRGYTASGRSVAIVVRLPRSEGAGPIAGEVPALRPNPHPALRRAIFTGTLSPVACGAKFCALPCTDWNYHQRLLGFSL